MNRLLAGGWVVLALDLVVLGLMVREVLLGDFGAGESGEAERAYATAVTAGTALWLCVVNILLLVGWWWQSRNALWAAVICGALPLLWAWTAVVQVLTQFLSAPQ